MGRLVNNNTNILKVNREKRGENVNSWYTANVAMKVPRRRVNRQMH